MTLIVRPSGSVCPMLFSDILITAEGVTQAIVVPAIGIDVTQELKKRSNRLPVDLMQKVYIIRNNLCVCFSGLVYQMKNLLQELILYTNKFDLICEKEVRYFFDEHYNIKEDFDRSSCLVLLIEKDEEGTIESKEFLVGKWQNTNSKHFSEVQASGSGCSQYLYDTTRDMLLQSSFSETDPNQAIVYNLCYIGKTLAIERTTWHTIFEHWGGGFELVIYNGNSFIKYDEVAYVINEAEFDTDGDIHLPFPTVIMYYKYYGDVLTIASIHTHNYHVRQEGNNIVMSSTEVTVTPYKVYGMIREEDEVPIPDLEKISFTTRRVVLGYAVKTPENGIFDPAFTIYSYDLEVSYDPARGVEILMNQEINTLIRIKAHEVFQKKWA